MESEAMKPMEKQMKKQIEALACLALLTGLMALPLRAGTIYTTSFESLNVSGRGNGNKKVEPGWVGESGYFAGQYGLDDVIEGKFSTPYGAQAAIVYNYQASETTAESTILHPVLVPGVTYTVTFNVAKATDLSGDYRVELVAFSPGESRNGNDLGSLLAFTSGTATLSDMSETDNIVFTPGAGHADLNKLLAIRIDGNMGGNVSSGTLIDNLIFSDDSASDVSPPIAIATSPQNGAPTNTKLVITFNENIVKGTGNIVLKRSSDDVTIDTIDVTSGNVTVVGAKLWISLSVALDNSAGYYVQFGAGLVDDGAGNSSPSSIADTTSWNFTTVLADGPTLLYETSFESPVVSGRSNNKTPTGWLIDGVGFGANRAGLYNEGSGNFATPYGAQGAFVYYGGSSFTTAEATFTETLTAGITYTVTFNLAKAPDLNGSYNVELLAFNGGDARNDQSYGTVLAEVSGTAASSDMQTEAASFSFTPGGADPNLGKLVALQIDGSGSGVLIDNIRLSNDAVGDVSPPALSAKSPLDDATTMILDFDFEITFTEDVTNGTGNIVIKRGSDDSVFESFDIVSTNVTFSGTNVVTFSPTNEFLMGTGYYVQIGTNAIHDLAGNAYAGITDTSTWNFTTVTVPVDQVRIILADSFESPDVSGKQQQTAPDNWLRASGEFYSSRCGMADTNSGVFTTPYGAQAAEIWHSYDAHLTVTESAVSEVIVSGVTYVVTFNVAQGDHNGNFLIELVAFDPGDSRLLETSGTVLASKSGQALSSDMSQRAGVTYTASGVDPNLGRLITVRLKNTAFFDNVKLTDNMTGDSASPVLSSTYPADDATTVTVDYDLTMTFNEDVTNGTGNIVIKKLSDDSVVETLDVTSGNVTFDGSRDVIINPISDLARGTAYYIEVYNGAITDIATNSYVGIANNATWNFTTVLPDAKNTIFADSFESPVVSGSLQKTAPAGWIRETSGSLAYWQNSGLANTNTSTFSTPYGDQAATVWHSSEASLTTEEAVISKTLSAGEIYTVTFNVAKASNLNGAYKVELVAFDPADVRDDHSYGSVVASVSGTASPSDMAAEADGFSISPDGTHPDIGRLLALQIEGGGALVDNLKLTYTPHPTTLLIFR
jgi:methionine-rich copper-binding protein CopC